MPGTDIVCSIYGQIVDGHIAGAGVDEGIARLSPKLVDATIELHRMVRRLAACAQTALGCMQWLMWKPCKTLQSLLLAPPLLAHYYKQNTTKTEMQLQMLHPGDAQLFAERGQVPLPVQPARDEQHRGGPLPHDQGGVQGPRAGARARP